MRRTALAVLAALLFAPTLRAARQAPSDDAPTLYVQAADGFDVDLAAALTHKKTPVRVVEDKEKAFYVLEATGVAEHEETTGAKVARCLFLDCIGMNGSSAVSVRLLRRSDGTVLWAYQVRKGFSGPMARQSLSEAIAKHLRAYLRE